MKDDTREIIKMHWNLSKDGDLGVKTNCARWVAKTLASDFMHDIEEAGMLIECAPQALVGDVCRNFPSYKMSFTPEGIKWERIQP